MTGYSATEVIDGTPRVLQGPKTDATELDRVRKALKAWRPVRAQLVNYTKAGVEFDVELDITPVADATGHVTHWIAIQRNVTARLKREAALRQSQKMEAVGQLTGGVAHDFNNLLAAISGSLEMVRLRVQQRRHAELDRYVDAALTSTNRAAALTQRLLAFARRQTLEPRATDVNELVAGMAELFRHTFGPSITIEHVVAEALWPTLCDPNQLENALLNLVINARDAMPEGGSVTIGTANLSLPGTSDVGSPRDVPAGEYVVLTVADDGAGMTPETMARAFDPFFTTKPLGQGTGLGLSMVYGFVRQTEGHVRLRSDPGSGTTVTILLPRHHGEVVRQPSHGPESPTPAATQVVILLVEDEPVIRMVVRETLHELGYAVLEADSGRAGLAIVESEVRIDLLLTDVGLPGGMNGRRLADEARALRPDLKVLFVTGYDASVAVGDPMPVGMQVVTKPFSVDALAARVRAMVATDQLNSYSTSAV